MSSWLSRFWARRISIKLYFPIFPFVRLLLSSLEEGTFASSKTDPPWRDLNLSSVESGFSLVADASVRKSCTMSTCWAWMSKDEFYPALAITLDLFLDDCLDPRLTLRFEDLDSSEVCLLWLEVGDLTKFMIDIWANLASCREIRFSKWL